MWPYMAKGKLTLQMKLNFLISGPWDADIILDCLMDLISKIRMCSHCLSNHIPLIVSLWLLGWVKAPSRPLHNPQSTIPVSLAPPLTEKSTSTWKWMSCFTATWPCPYELCVFSPDVPSSKTHHPPHFVNTFSPIKIQLICHLWKMFSSYSGHN